MTRRPMNQTNLALSAWHGNGDSFLLKEKACRVPQSTLEETIPYIGLFVLSVTVLLSNTESVVPCGLCEGRYWLEKLYTAYLPCGAKLSLQKLHVSWNKMCRKRVVTQRRDAHTFPVCERTTVNSPRIGCLLRFDRRLQLPSCRSTAECRRVHQRDWIEISDRRPPRAPCFLPAPRCRKYRFGE